MSTLVPLLREILISSIMKRLPGDEHFKMTGRVDEMTEEIKQERKVISLRI